MEKYLIYSNHSIHKFDYEEGEKDFVNEYELKEFIQAENPKEAICKYLDEVLFYSIDTNEIDLGNSFCFSFDILVDANNCQANIGEIEYWKKGLLSLYNDYVTLKIYELNLITAL